MPLAVPGRSVLHGNGDVDIDNNEAETPLADPDGDRWWYAGRVGH